MDNLESRIRALEASNRHQRYSITALAAIIVGGAFIAATRPAGDATFDTVTCKKWSLVDKDGKVRIGAQVRPNGDAGMVWTDTNGKTRIGVSIATDGTAATAWFDKDGKMRIGATTSPDGTAAMSWLDTNAKIRIVACTDATGNVILPTSDLTPKP